MKKWLFILDIGLGLLLILFVLSPTCGCTAEQSQKIADELLTPGSATQVIAGTAAATIPVMTVAANSLGWPAWVILILNVLSSTATAIVAGRAKKTE